MAGVTQIDLACPGEGHAVTAVASRHHAIEHIDAARNGFQYVFRRAYAHQIARTVGRQDRHDLLDHRKHHRLWFTDRKAADRIAVKADIDQSASAGAAQFTIVTALNDAEQHVSGWRGLECAPAAFAPSQRELHGAL